MKSVAGRMRLDLAQYRELEAFAQFGSDLDAATQRQLAKGARMVEILKQPQYSPMPVASQIAVIYAVTNNHVDHVPVEKIRAWELGFHEYMGDLASDVLEAITTEKHLSEDLTGRLVDAITAYNELWASTEGVATEAVSAAS
jgi:F-type H+-transporting ATPase subunit alpha